MMLFSVSILLLILFCVLVIYWQDCKTIGKNKLAVPLRERLLVYVVLFVVPIIFIFLKK